MKLTTLCFGIALGVLPVVATAAASGITAASGVEDCYYYHGRHYAYRWNGHYWRYRWNGGYYNYRYGDAYYRYYRHGHYYNYYHGHRYYRDRYRCNPHGWCYR